MKPLVHPVLFCLLAFLLYFAGLGTVGLVGPDEPRYADVARGMLRSGDYITPRLFGEPWFEKPPLYYWLAALLFRLGVNEWTARMPSALFAAGFVALWLWFASRFYGRRVALLAAMLLASSVGWIGFARAAAMDMLLASTLDAALVFLCLWLWEKRAAALYGFYGMLGVATLAKGPVAVALAALIALAYLATYRDWAKLRELVFTPAAGLFLAVAAPWYALCYQQNGFAFVQEFFIRHNLERYTSDAIGHPQPVWFYIPIAAAALFPWTPLLLLPIREGIRRGVRPIFADPQRAFLFWWVVLPFVFFSLSRNKLPGYLLPILPPLTLRIAQLAVQTGKAAASANPKRDHLLPAWLVGVSASLLLALPLVTALLPESLATGLGRALGEWDAAQLGSEIWRGPVPAALWIGLFALVAASVWLLWRKQLVEAAFAALLGVALGIFAIVEYLPPSINRVASVRSVARRIESYGIPAAQVAVFRLHRNQSLGLSFYLDRALPEWSPDVPTPGISLVVAAQEAEFSNAESLVLFPGQRLRVWQLVEPGGIPPQ